MRFCANCLIAIRTTNYIGIELSYLHLYCLELDFFVQTFAAKSHRAFVFERIDAAFLSSSERIDSAFIVLIIYVLTYNA